MPTGFSLIDRAAKECGSRYKLAQRLNESESFLGRIARGSSPMPPSLAGRIAELIGMDPREAALHALVSQEKDPVKRAEIARVFNVQASEANDSGLCIMSTIKRALMALVPVRNPYGSSSLRLAR